MNRAAFLFGSLVLWFLGFLFLGCGSGGRVPIRGKVKFKDGSDVSVLAGYTVTFENEKESGFGEIQKDGTFQIATEKANDGVAPGTHKIVVTQPLPVDPDKPRPKSAIPAKYADFGSSGLTRDIAPGKGDVELELERAP